MASTLPGRNAPCPCGSGKKYKQCCGAAPARASKPSACSPEDPLDALRARLIEWRKPSRAERPPALFLCEIAREFKELGSLLARMMGYGTEAETKNALLLLFLAARDPSVPAARRREIRRSAVPPLLAAMKDAAVEDDRKYSIGPLLDAFGDALQDEEYRASFRDFDATCERKSAEVTDGMSGDLRELHEFLVGNHVVGEGKEVDPDRETLERALGTAAEIGSRRPEVGAPILACVAAIAVEQGAGVQDLPKALRWIRGVASPKAAWYVGELAAWPALGELGEVAKGLAAELAAEGVVPVVHANRTFSHGWVSHVDGVGSRSASLYLRTPNGGMDAVMFLLNDERGVKDVWAVFEEGADVERQYRRGTNLDLAPLSLPQARELLGDALAAHAERSTPPPGRLLAYRPMLGADPILPRRRTPNLGAYALELVPRGTDLSEGSEALCDLTCWKEMWCATDEAYAWVKANVPWRAARTWRPGEETVYRYVREVVEHDRDRLLAHMALNLEFLAWAGRAREASSRLAARTWLTLQERLAPIEQVPFVCAQGIRSLAMIANNLALGYGSQREVNDHVR